VKTPSRLPAILWASAVSLACAALLVATSSWLPMVWDEGDTIVRAEPLTLTLSHEGRGDKAIDAPRARDDSQDARDDGAGWPYTTVREGHPPLAGIAIALGTRIAPGWLDPLTQARFGPIVLFALAAGAMFYRLTRDYQVPAVSFMAVAALLTMPRLFAHAHFATLDGPVTASWILTWAAFAPACRGWRWIPSFGLALGLALSAKFTGWLAPLPFVAWTILYRDRGGIRALALGAPIAIGVFMLLNPPLWQEPLAGLRTFFELNLNRAARPEHNITTQFLGRLYNLDYPLPWYNTLVWTAITITPVVFLLGAMGIYASIRRWRSDRASMLLVLNWATLVIARALPIAPPHDGERLFLPSFAFFAALVGVGIGRALYRNTLLVPEKIPAQGWAKVAMAIVLAAAAFDSVSYFPHNLSYYSRVIGGLRGATALGMEPTYYWDSLDRAALDWLAEHTADDEKVAFAAAPPRNLELLKRWGLLERLPSDRGRFRWYVLQRRPSAWRPADRWLVEHQQPAFQRSFAGVPLLDVYSYQQYEQALAATR
jgi:4-amino-4-deoxy-L-arabinose transferase-like glycosyltransferase